MSRLLQKSSGSCDDEFYARNFWPGRDSHCAAVLGPMDGIRDEPKTVSEMYAEDERCCPVCGTFRRKVELFDIEAMYPVSPILHSLWPRVQRIVLRHSTTFASCSWARISL